MRVVVIGTSGAGKSTMAEAIAARFAIPLVELDALNWQPGWVSLMQSDFPAFCAAVDAATAGPDWVVAGNYTQTRHIIWARATHLVWLDYPKAVVMRRVIGRSFHRAVTRAPMWNGNREGFHRWLGADHPIWWAWRTWQKNRTNTIARLSEPGSAHLRVLQVMRPGDAPQVLERLALDAAAPPRADI